MPDIRTPEGREELRRMGRQSDGCFGPVGEGMNDYGWAVEENIDSALDGLDITQEMAWGYRVEDALLEMPKWEGWDYWYDAALDFLDGALVKWDNWKGTKEGG